MMNFDEYAMTGVSEEDNKAIMEHLENGIELTVDETGRVWNSGGQWIADCVDTEEGNGIAC